MANNGPDIPADNETGAPDREDLRALLSLDGLVLEVQQVQMYRQ